MIATEYLKLPVNASCLNSLQFVVLAVVILAVPMQQCWAVTGGTVIDDQTSRAYQAVGKLTIGGLVANCTGTLITPKLVLTAAHCVCSGTSCKKTADFFVNAGIYKKTFSGSVRVHPEYLYILSKGFKVDEYGTQYMGIDLAVIELTESPSGAPYSVTPIPLANPGNMPNLGDTLILVGTSDTAPNCMGEPHKAKVTLPLTDYENASRTMMFDDPVKHACPADSGGPVLNTNGEVVGVMKQGGSTTSVTIAHPIAAHYDWIMTGAMSLSTTNIVTEPNITRNADHKNLEDEYDRSYESFTLAVDSANLCLNECAADGFCKAWEYKPSKICCPKTPICWLTTTIGTPQKAQKGRLSGIKVVPANQLD